MLDVARNTSASTFWHIVRVPSDIVSLAATGRKRNNPTVNNAKALRRDDGRVSLELSDDSRFVIHCTRPPAPAEGARREASTQGLGRAAYPHRCCPSATVMLHGTRNAVCCLVEELPREAIHFASLAD